MTKGKQRHQKGRIYTNRWTGQMGTKHEWAARCNIHHCTFTQLIDKYGEDSHVPYQFGPYSGVRSQCKNFVEKDGLNYSAGDIADLTGASVAAIAEQMRKGKTFDELIYIEPREGRRRNYKLKTNPFTGKSKYSDEWAKVCNTTEGSFNERYYRLGPDDERTWRPVQGNGSVRGVRHDVSHL